MRDPERIEELLALVREIWTRDPDLRLCQLVFNAVRAREPSIQDIYNVEDGVLRKGLVRYLERLDAARAHKDVGQ